ncbi:MAG: hypothetical protein HY762_06975 [Planctomycetes bacterium]|nr:hypothetical protein [Planctomycetota bacterium]
MNYKHINIIIALLVVMLISLAPLGGGGGGAKPPVGGGGLGAKIAAGSTMEETPINWRGATIKEALKIAKPNKRVVFIYFYFNSKDEFPANYDAKLAEYSDKRAVFSKIFVRTDTKGKIVEPEVTEFFAKHKLSAATVTVLLDYYGNLLFSAPGQMQADKIMSTIDTGDKKACDIESDFNKRYEKAEKLEKEKKTADLIKALQQIVNDKNQCYPAIDKSRAKLDELDKAATQEHNKIVKAYGDTPEEERDKDKTAKELENLQKAYKGLPVEKLLQQSISQIKKGETPSAPEEKPAEEEKKTEPPKHE